MEKAKKIIPIIGVFILLFSYGSISGTYGQTAGSKTDQTSSKSIQTKAKTTPTATKSKQTTAKSVQTKTKSAQPASKSVKPAPKSTKSEPDKKVTDFGIVRIGTQSWAIASLNVSTFRNGDSIPEARSNKDWVAAGESGKPAWCYYNNDPANGPKYGKLYNWFAVNDPRGLAPEGWTLSSDADWYQLTYSLGGEKAAGYKMKSKSGWSDGNNGSNEIGFIGLPGGYRVENGTFLNLGSIGIWWSSTESNTLTAFDHYLALSGSLSKSSSPKQRGASVRCIRK
jgi:uncharacterized protein (TIGR02145 family)